MISLLAEFYGTPWALDPTTFHVFEEVLQRWHAGVRLTAEEIRAAVDGPRAARAERAQAARESSAGGVAVVPVYGVLTHRGYAVDNSSQALTSTERLASTLRALVADQGVAAVCLDFDTPGGSVFGCTELASTIQSLREQKPIVGIANAQAASGGYWALSQCTEVVVTPSGAVGSIGVIMAHEDRSKALEQEGVRREYIFSGENKAEGNPTGPLSDKSRAHYQALSDTYYSQFTRDVAKGRNVPVDTVRSEEWGRGRVLLAGAALQAGMVDRLDTLENTISRLAKPQARRALMSASTAQARVTALRLGAPIDA